MKNNNFFIFIETSSILVFLMLTLTTCTPERDNPWDEMATINPSEWAPTSLTLTVNSLNSITLTWQHGIVHFEGFMIDRRVDQEEWQDGFATLTNDKRTFTDATVLMPEKSYTYRVYAFAGKNKSASIEGSVDPLSHLPQISTTQVINISATTASSGGNISSDGGIEVTARGLVWSTNQNPTTASNQGITSNGTGMGSFTGNMNGLVLNTTYYVRAYATNALGTTYGNQQVFTTLNGVPVLTTNNVTSIAATTAVSGGNITSDGGIDITARGVVWSTSQNPTTTSNQGITTNGAGAGSFTSNLSGLALNTTYYVRAYATNSQGTHYGNQQFFSTLNATDVTNPATGKTWMDRNLGATRAATSSTDAQAYGDLYQWGRRTDGHEKRNSTTQSTLSSSDTPGHGNFILTSAEPYDWRSPQNTNLWQGVNGVNNPCPSGYRLPTEAEWNSERMSWSSNDAAGAFASPLKLPVAGLRGSSVNVIIYAGEEGYYWSSTVFGFDSYLFNFYSDLALSLSLPRSWGNSVRCIKD